jgi:alkylation response protein AidB-like acyl-CoA dehydrogenase
MNLESNIANDLIMHTHPLATNVWRWRRARAPFERLLRRVADERLRLVTSGASDWLDGTGVAVRVEGGWRITARKIFASGSPVGDLLMTTAVDATSGPEPVVLHFALPLVAASVTVLDNWHTLGMRGTGSHDVVIDNVHVPEVAIAMRRPPGKWVPRFQLIQMTALPLILGCYLGVAEAMRDRAVAMAMKRQRGRARQAATGCALEPYYASAIVDVDKSAEIAGLKPL